MFNNKKANFADIAIIIIIVFVIGAVTIFMYYIGSQVNDNMQNNNDLTNTSKEIMQNNLNSFVPIFDGLFLFILFGLAITVFISAFFINQYPVFYVFSLLIMAILIIVSAIFNNAFNTFATTEPLVNASNQFPLIGLVFNGLNFPLIIMFISLFVALFMYGKGQE